VQQLIELVPHVDLQQAFGFLQTPETGGIDLFVGTVRNHANGKSVLRLDFEAYEPMALAELEKIAARAAAQWPVQRLVIQHALGTKLVGEPVVITGIAAAHRQAAFEACCFLIDELKRSVPIWKKEYYTDSSIWVAAHP
jgi:molybdopterin synthase catalytic subunit